MSAADPYGDYYYYGDNNNYTETYIHDYELNQQTALQGGIGFCLFAGISLMLYLRLLFIIHYDKELNKLSSYQIILQNGCSDCITLVLWIICSFESITLLSFNSIFIKICGSIYQFSIYTSSSFILLLSINRFINIAFGYRIDDIFSKKLTKIYIIVCWLISLPMPIICLTSIITFRYYPYWLDWGYKTFNSRRHLFKAIDFYFVFVKVGIATIVYFLIIGYIILKRQKVSKVEVRLSVQTMIDALFRMGGFIYWNFLAGDGTGSLYTTIIQNSLILVGFCLNAFIYPTFNQSIRRKFVPQMIRKMFVGTKQIVIFGVKMPKSNSVINNVLQNGGGTTINVMPMTR